MHFSDSNGSCCDYSMYLNPKSYVSMYLLLNCEVPTKLRVLKQNTFFVTQTSTSKKEIMTTCICRLLSEYLLLV